MPKRRDLFSTYILIFVFLLSACSGNETKSSIKFKQYFIKGEQLYVTHCSNCHQKDGSGLGTLYPPLNKSDYMRAETRRVICLIKNGIQGEMIVNGKTYDKEMPAMPALTNIEIAEITTYIYSAWDNEGELVDVKTVTSVLDSCGRF